MHGHRYVAEITVTAEILDDVGRIIDFSKIKEVVGGWIDEYWDHNFLCHEDDLLLNLPNEGKPLFSMPVNPTAENMASLLLGIAVGLLAPYDIQVTKIKLFETPNCWAEVWV